MSCISVATIRISLTNIIVIVVVAIDIPFETEMELRVRGTSRTPDILFSCPVAIQVPKRILSPANRSSVQGIKDKHMDADASEEDFVWKMICWIDSKVSEFEVAQNQS